MTRSIWLVLSLISSSVLYAGENISPGRQQDLRNLLIQDCGSCHGLTMKGGLGPALLPSKLRGKTAETISSIILDGRPGTQLVPRRRRRGRLMPKRAAPNAVPSDGAAARGEW